MGSEGLPGRLGQWPWVSLRAGLVVWCWFLFADGGWGAFRCLASHWPGPGPAAGLLLCVAKEVGKKGDPAEPAVCSSCRLIRRLPCAAHNRRPAQNSRAAPAQTAAPDIPACCCAARRLGRGFPESPRVSGRACVIDAKAKIPVSSLLTQEGRVSAAYPDTALADDIRRFSKGSVSADSPF